MPLYIKKRVTRLIEYSLKTRNFFILISILLVSVAFRGHWAYHKGGMNCDEVLSFTLCNYNDPTWSCQLLGNMSGAEIKNVVMVNDPSIFGCISDIFHLYISTRDQPHTNFYYSLLRLSIIGLDTVDIKNMNNRAIALNLLFYFIEFFFFIKLLKIYFEDKPYLLYGGLICFSMMSALVSDTLLARDYQIQEMAFVILAYWITIIVRSLRDGSFIYNKRNFAITVIIVSVSMLTGYFAVFFVAFMGLFLFKELYDSDKIKKGTIFFAGTVIVSVTVCSLLYHSYYMGFLGDGRIKDVVFGDGALARAFNAFTTYFEIILSNVLYWPIAILLCATAVLHIEKIKTLPWVFLPTLCYTLFIFIIAPFKEIRYIVGALPLFALLIPYFISQIRNEMVKKILICVISFFYVIIPCFERNISNLEKNEGAKKMLSCNENIIIVQSKSAWPITSLIPFMDDDIIYDIVNEEPKYPKRGSIVAFDNTVHDYDCIKKSSSYKYLNKYGFFDFYIVK